MSKIALTPNISGSGTFAIAAPNSNSDVTLTLPTASGTLATTETAGFPSGTVMLFAQTAAPTGWTKSISHDNKALRVVSGSAGSGGSAGFTTALGTPSVSGSLSGTVGSTTLSTAQMPSHTHLSTIGYIGTYGGAFGGGGFYGGGGSGTKDFNASTGGGGSHDHSFSGSLSGATAAINVAYVDVIIATKD